ncbi:hypothetical protein NBRC10512_002175 [Rhodotorula toruloides]|nr:uncharacterized protein RHTO_07276 [Rhodotorula toruloides NP11]EMS23542.1 hypothetical protein RHTO_07276 [Rhodotorula toruloides NP11]
MDMYSAAVTMHLCPIFRQVPLPAPAPASSLRIACDEALRAFPIELGPNADLTSRTILGGSISVHDSAGQCLSSLVLGPSQFPPASRITFYASAHKPPRPGQYSVAIHLIWAPQAQEQPEGAAAAQPPQEVDVPEDIANYARLATSFCRNGTPHDVCIDFPHVGLQLWGNQKRLSKQSPYLKVLLRNKEIETSTVHPPILPPPDWAWNCLAKVVFRLAKQFQLEDLAEQAMARLLAQITPQNALLQLYALSSQQHAEIIDNLVEYVVENWAEVFPEDQAAGNHLLSLVADPSRQEVTMQLRPRHQRDMPRRQQNARGRKDDDVYAQATLEDPAANDAMRLAARAATTYFQTPRRNNVCLDFPSAERQIWVEERLHQYSPFFALLEDELQDPNRRRPLAANRFPEAWYPVEDDSDNERDDVFRNFGNPQFGHLDESHMPSKFSTVREASWTTFLSVLVWRESGFISFAPMWHSEVEDDGFPVEDAPSVPLQPDLSLPLPVSPTSVFRLAKILGFDELAAFALPIVLEQVTPLTALYEVYTMASCHNAELRDPLVAMLAECWDEAKESYWVDRLTPKLHSTPPEATVVTTQLTEALARRGVRYGPNM